MPQPAVQLDLVQLDEPDLRRLAADEPVSMASRASAGALPPAFVARRALAQLQEGVAPFWCVPMLMIERGSGTVLGGCSFKGGPTDRRVEIGYGVAASHRGRGVATVAIGEMIRLAAATGEVDELVAHIVPDNLASARLAARLGFAAGPTFPDKDGELVVEWTRPLFT